MYISGAHMWNGNTAGTCLGEDIISAALTSDLLDAPKNKDISKKESKSKEIINTRQCLEIPWIKSKVRDGMFLDVWCCNVKGLLLKNYI